MSYVIQKIIYLEKICICVITDTIMQQIIIRIK